MWQLSNSNNISPIKDQSLDDFGNPFCTLIKDPLFEDLDNIPISALPSNMFSSSATTYRDDDKYSTMIQISPKLSSSSSDISCCTNYLRLMKPLDPNHELICNDHVNHMMISCKSSRSTTSNYFIENYFIENRSAQISSPQYTGIKKRKGQAKKVVCIPAPAPVNSRPTGEVVPSDLWAWRKYGHKTIKGSPYPRGYYRCSSSKGCSARKQVERSRTDPNMLIITYNSEQNHPWPTQRNALAGCTRKSPLPSLKEKHKEMSNNIVTANICSENVKDEEKDTGMEDEDQYINNSDKDFFTELEKIEADPFELMFSQGFTGEGIGSIWSL